MKSILLIEDSVSFQTIVKHLLSNHSVIVTDDPDMVFPLLSSRDVGLILLDISLPKKDGYTILSELKVSEFSEIPVICLTGRSEISDKISAFSLGADDYIQKPFDPLEFKARVDSKFLKSQKADQVKNTITIGDIRLDMLSHRVMTLDNVEISLTQTEFKILSCLCKHPGNVFSREQLLSIVWGDEGAVFDRTVDVRISSLRKKLFRQQIKIKSVIGVGYKVFVEKNL